MKLGDYFTLREMTRTHTGIRNNPNAKQIARLTALVAHVLDPLRRDVCVPVHITSGYRSPAVNVAIGGSKSSQHTLGEAADLRAAGYDARDLALRIVELSLPFDQLIWYAPERGGHIHVSYTVRRDNRQQVLHAPAGGGYVKVGEQ